MPTIYVTERTYERLQELAEPFRTHRPDRPDTPDKVITMLLDDHEQANAIAAGDNNGETRDATAAELLDEPDGVLTDLAAGELGATEQTRHLAQAELDHRRQKLHAEPEAAEPEQDGDDWARAGWRP